MGNELSVKVPALVQTADYYVAELPDFNFVQSLGSTRFMKVAKVLNNEGVCVLKIFVHQDPSIGLDSYRLDIERLRDALRTASNCLPFQRIIITPRSAVLVRQYCRYTLFDRLSTRPYFEEIEKRWIAMQLLRALQQCNEAGVCHGDIKTQNILVTSWNWVLLSDFASYKPAALPHDNPSDYSYFFDTSRRRHCYIAPERFVSTNELINADRTVLNTPSSSAQALSPAMDLFSLGCVLYELFTDGQIPFTFGQMLSYRGRTERGCDLRILESLSERKSLLHLIVPLLDRQPEHRPSASKLLDECRGKFFPEILYDFCWPYFERFARQPLLTHDEIINRLHSDVDHILRQLQPNNNNTTGDQTSEEAPGSDAYLLFVGMVTSHIRSLKTLQARLNAMRLLVQFSDLCTDVVILDRILPHLLYMLCDMQERVRAEAIVCVTRVLDRVAVVPRDDARVFHDYILPRIHKLTSDHSSVVRCVLATHISRLACIALKFTNSAAVHYTVLDPQVQQPTTTTVTDGSQSGQTNAASQQRLKREAHELREYVQEIVVNLLCDSQNAVRRAIVEQDLKSLCEFFGKQRASDIILSHMITFLNDKTDVRLRASFFTCCPPAAAYVGWQSTIILKPLLQQGLCDTEPVVVECALLCIACLCRDSLLQKSTIYELLSEAVPFLAHPCRSIRLATLTFLCNLEHSLNVADLHCKVLPLVASYFQQTSSRLNKMEILIGNLCPPLPTGVWDLAVKSHSTVELLEFIENKSVLHKLTPDNNNKNYASSTKGGESMTLLPDDKALASLYQKMRNQGLDERNELKLLAFSTILAKMRKLESSSSTEFSPTSGLRPGVVALTDQATHKHADLSVHHRRRRKRRPKKAQGTGSNKIVTQISAAMNDEWNEMFGGPAPLLSSKITPGAIVSTDSHDVHNIQQASTTSNTTTIDASGSVTATPIESSVATTTTNEDDDDLATLVTDDSVVISDALIDTSSAMDTHGKSFVASRGRSTKAEVTGSEFGGMPAPDTRQLGKAILEKFPARVSVCRESLSDLIEYKREQWHRGARFGGSAITPDSETSVGLGATSGWAPMGQPLAHVHEHKAAVRRLSTHPNGRYFASCSHDGTVKLWDTKRIEGETRDITHRSLATYNGYGDRLRCLQFLSDGDRIATCGDRSQVHVVPVLDARDKRTTVLTTDQNKHGFVVELQTWSDGWSELVLGLSHHGYLLLWDLRADTIPIGEWSNDMQDGLVTSMCLDTMHQQWACVGTASGRLAVWDMRFHLPVNIIRYPHERCVTRVWMPHSTTSSPNAVWAAVTGNGEVALWDLETSSRHCAVWPSSTAPLSYQHTSTLCQTALYPLDNNRVLTADTQGIMRIWHLSQPTQSRVLTAPAGYFRAANTTQQPPSSSGNSTSFTVRSPPNQSYQYETSAVSYKMQSVDGVSVITETKRSESSTQQQQSSLLGAVKSLNVEVSTWHRDTIGDLAVVHSGDQCMLVSAGHDGVIKVWL